MKLEDLQKIDLGVYTPEDFSTLKQTKNRILKIIKRYVSNDDVTANNSWDNYEAIFQDMIQISSLLMFMAPKIGHLEGIADSVDEIKKLSIAMSRNDITSEEKKLTRDDKEAIARESSKQVILNNVYLSSLALEYRRFLFQTNSWIETMGRRINALNKERNNQQYGN